VSLTALPLATPTYSSNCSTMIACTGHDAAARNTRTR
jgi:hypothetical protein